MTRLGPFVAAMVAVGALGAVVTGSPLVLAGLVLLAALAAVLQPATVRRAPDLGWSAPPAAVADVSRARAATQAPSLVRMSPRAVGAALGRVEVRELATSAWFGAGLGFCVLLWVLFGLVFPGDRGSLWSETTQLAPWFAHPLIGMTILAVHRSATRADRDGTADVLDTCPTRPATRTIGLLRTAWLPPLVFTVFFGAWVATVLARGGSAYGPLGGEQVLDVTSAAVLTVGGVALGVALGEWARFGLAPALAVAAVLVVTLRLATTGDPGWNPLAELSTFPPLSEVGSVFSARPAGWHLLWILGLTVGVAALAVAHHRRDRWVAGVAGVAVVLSVASGVGATRPIGAADAALIAERIISPEDHQDCTAGAGGKLLVCTYHGYGGAVDEVMPEAAAVAAAVPARAGVLTLRHGFPSDSELDDLPPEVRSLLPDGIAPLGPNEMRLDFQVEQSPQPLVRFDVALTALGLPLETAPDEPPSVIAGQARGVVALWLATRGLDLDEARDLATAHEPDAADPFLRGLTWPESCVEPPVVWSAQDLEAARTLMGQPDRAVAAVVDSGWDRWRDPATGTDALLAELGLPAVGPFDAIVARTGAVQEC